MDGRIIGDSNSLFIKLNGFENLAQPGFRVKDTLAQLCELENGKTLIVGAGVNDCAIITDIKSGNKLEPNLNEFKVDYQKLLDMAKAKFSKIFVLGVISSTEEKVKLGDTEIQYSNQTVGEFNEAIKDLCAKLEVEFVDLLPHFLGKEKELLADHIHPNETARDIILSRLNDKLSAN